MFRLLKITSFLMTFEIGNLKFSQNRLEEGSRDLKGFKNLSGLNF